MQALEHILNTLRSTTGFSPQAKGDTWSARCPAHDDRNPSLVVREGDKGVILKCHAGCQTADIVRALGLEWQDLFNEPLTPTGPSGPGNKQIECTYDYTDEGGTLLFQVLRYTPKGFAQRKPNADGTWDYRLGDVRRPLYRLPEVVKAVESDRWVILVEGEKDVASLVAVGLCATTTPGGSGAWRRSDTSALKGAKVAIVMDNDEPGRKYAGQAAADLVGLASYLVLIDLPGLGDKEDVTDWLAKPGNDVAALKELIKHAPQYQKVPDSTLVPSAVQDVQIETTKSGKLVGKPSVHYAEDAEREIIAAAMSSPELLLDIASELAPEDFYTPKWRHCWSAFVDLFGERGVMPDAISLADAARLEGASVTSDELKGLQTEALGVTEAHVDAVRRTRATRDVIAACKQTLATVNSGGDPYDAIDDLTTLDRDISTFSRQPQSISIDEFIAGAGDASPWVIPGLVRIDTTAIIVAGEGAGKAVNGRTIAMAAAQGYHPYTHDKIEPIRTMVVDAENSRFSIAETAGVLSRTLRMRAGAAYDPSRCHIWHQPQGLNLIRRSDRAALQREIAAHRPKMVFMGPLYDLFRRRERDSYESAADAVLDVFDDLRIRYGFALIIEHHSNKSVSGGQRTLMPADSMRFLQWPELGITLREDEEDGSLVVGRYRGDRVRVCWPDKIDRDPEWLVDGWYENGFRVDW